VSGKLVYGRFSYLLNSLACMIESLPLLAVGVCGLIYTLIAYLAIESKMLWDDEFFTYYISRSPNISQIWSALATGADQHPPFFYLLTHASMRLLGESHFSLRLPAMLGVAMMSFCIFQFVARRTSAVFGLVAMLLALGTQTFVYACEARGYGLMLGFAGLALLSWQCAAERHHRRLALFGIAIGTAGAVASHYYSILLLFPLGLGEGVRSLVRKRIDVPIWLAFLSPAFVFVFSFPLIISSQAYSKTFWATPHWRQPLTFYAHMLGFDFGMLALLVASTLYLRLGFAKAPSPKRDSNPDEMVALVALLALPFVGVLLAKLKTNAYSDRYFLIAVLGFVILLTYLMYDWFDARQSIGVLLVGVLMVSFCLHGYFFIESQKREVMTSVDQARYLLTNATEKQPIVIAEVSIFHRLSYYASRSLAGRLVFAASPNASVRYIGHDTIDRGLLALRPWFPLRTLPYETEVRNLPGFYVFGYPGQNWVWLYSQLTEDKLNGRLLGRFREQLFVSVGTKGQRAETAGGLTLTYGPVIANEGASLCRQWNRDNICSLFP
jgi:hypothetical protein